MDESLTGPPPDSDDNENETLENNSYFKPKKFPKLDTDK